MKKGKWIKKKNQVFDKGPNLLVKKVDGDDVVECWVINI